MAEMPLVSGGVARERIGRRAHVGDARDVQAGFRMDKALARGLVVNLTAKQVVRLAPPINISKADWESGLERVVELIVSL